jgi:hypothetical protein
VPSFGACTNINLSDPLSMLHQSTRPH